MDRPIKPVLLLAALMALTASPLPAGAGDYGFSAGWAYSGDPAPINRGLDRPGLGEGFGGPSFEALPQPRGQGWFPSTGYRPARGRFEHDDGAPTAPAEPYERAWTSFPHAPPVADPYRYGPPIDLGVVVEPRRRY